MSMYYTCEGRNAAILVFTKHLMSRAKPSHTHLFDTLLLKADFMKLLV